MAVKKRGLGRGLDALLKSGVVDNAEEASGAVALAAEPEGRLHKLPLETIRRGRYQPRTRMDQGALEELADSIRAQGVIQPIVVRPVEDGYEIIAGERRWRAAALAQLDTIPAVVRQLSDRAALALALIENIQREDLNPLEEALALKRLVDEFELTHQQAAEAVGRSRAAVSNLLRLLELDEQVRQMLLERRLEMGHARALLPLEADLQREGARQVQLRGLSVRETEELVRKLQQPGQSARSRSEPDPDIRILQEDLAERLGARVQLQHNASGKGRLVIHYNNLDELDGIIGHVK
ncbi:MAG: ParB/RepB/Spo0J family partition protein [Candidatus Competibacteraceae bacterium]|nr:ParB/RepB/Spo0J family partition protein [Candidatus Competibacteraceae bacterium]